MNVYSSTKEMLAHLRGKTEEIKPKKAKKAAKSKADKDEVQTDKSDKKTADN